MLHRIRGLFIIITLLGAAALALPAALAQSPVNSLAITYLEAAAEPGGEVRVTGLVSVLDEAGQPVPGLAAGDFLVTENGAPILADALTVGPAGQPVKVLLLLDTSKPMARPAPNGVRAIDSAKDGAIQFIEALGDGDEVAVYTYNSGLSLSQDFTADHNLAIDRGVVGLDVSEAEPACLYDALQQILDSPGGQPEGRRLIVIVTGSPAGAAEACGGASREEVLQAATIAGSQMPIFSIGYGGVDQEDLALLARVTGGQSLIGEDAGSLPGLLAQVGTQLKQQYEISYTTALPAGLAKISIQEQASRQADSRQVFIPAAIEPTPTPVPQFSVELVIEVNEGKTLLVTVGVPPGVTLVKTTLSIDGRLFGQNTAPPLDKFEVDLLELGSGKHTLRVEAEADSGGTAAAEREVDLTIPPTPVPTPTPLPEPSPTPAVAISPLASGQIPSLAILLVIAGLVLLLVLVIVLIVYFAINSRRPQPVQVVMPAAPLPPPEIPAMITMAGAEMDFEKTHDPGEAVATPSQKARLMVVEGRQAVAQPYYDLYKDQLSLGRNTAKEKNDVDIQDREVSRNHAKITYRDGEFFIQDLGSSTGTSVNGKKLPPFKDMPLYDRAELQIGPRIKFLLEITRPAARDNAVTRDYGSLMDSGVTRDDEDFKTQIR